MNVRVLGGALMISVLCACAHGSASRGTEAVFDPCIVQALSTVKLEQATKDQLAANAKVAVKSAVDVQAGVNNSADLEQKIDATFQDVSDDNVTCLFWLRTTGCAIQKGGDGQTANLLIGAADKHCKKPSS